jgi:hypothetical protein
MPEHFHVTTDDLGRLQRVTPAHWVSPSCDGERCRICMRQATHKVGEEIPADDPLGVGRHNLTAYVCCGCFAMVFGSAVLCDTSRWPRSVLMIDDR